MILVPILAAALAAAVAPAEPAPPPAPLACERPRVPHRVSVAPEDVAYLVRKTQAYGDCVRAYVDARNREIERLQARAKAEADAATAAAGEAQALYAEVKAVQDQNKPGAGR